jgi:hypothetical protein
MIFSFSIALCREQDDTFSPQARLAFAVEDN